ncbi:MAG: hypothetical protein ACKOWH_05030 [Rhodoluna sp.]
MKKFFWIIVGIFAGIEIKKQLDQNPAAQAKLDEFTAKARELGDTAMDSFRERTAELSGKPAARKKPAKKSSTAKKPAAKKATTKKSPATKPVNKPAN